MSETGPRGRAATHRGRPRGVAAGAFFARRNERQAHADRLLAEALNELVGAVAEVAAGDASAQRRYAGATSRIVLHGSPALVHAMRSFQDDPTTGTKDGRRRFITALQAARRELGRPTVDDGAAAVLLFGVAGPR